MEDNELRALIRETNQLAAKNILTQVEVMLLDLEIAHVKAWPNSVDVKPHAQKIVAFLREHLVR